MSELISEIRDWVTGHFALLMVLCFSLGVTLPGLANVPDQSVSVLVAAVMFLACFKVSLHEIREIDLKGILLFYFFRFIVLPLVLFWISSKFAPAYAVAVLVLSLMPVGVSAPSVTGLVGGNVSLVVAMVVLSSAASPVLVPGFVGLLLDTEFSIDTYSIFYMLSLVVVLPMLLHLPFRRPGRSREFIDRNNAFLSVVFICLMATLVIAKRRDVIFEDPFLLLELLFVLFVQFAIFYAFSFFVMRTLVKRDTSAYTISSGVINNGLAMGIALLYLPPVCALYIVISEVPWIAGMIGMKHIFGKNLAEGGEEFVSLVLEEEV